MTSSTMAFTRRAARSGDVSLYEISMTPLSRVLIVRAFDRRLYISWRSFACRSFEACMCSASDLPRPPKKGINFPTIDPCEFASVSSAKSGSSQRSNLSAASKRNSRDSMMSSTFSLAPPELGREMPAKPAKPPRPAGSDEDLLSSSAKTDILSYFSSARKNA